MPSTTEPAAPRGRAPDADLAPDPLTERVRVTWTAGDFGRIAKTYERGAAEFIARLGLRPGEQVLDVACGTGNLALPAARAGALVTGIDIAPNLIEQAQASAAEEGLPVAFEVGDAERLPYADAGFASVVSMFGTMFAARPERAAAELLRVTRPGGRIALASWTPAGFVGEMLKTTVRFVPPPAGLPSPRGGRSPSSSRSVPPTWSGTSSGGTGRRSGRSPHSTPLGRQTCAGSWSASGPAATRPATGPRGYSRNIWR
jgi:SAM-dependent methyltransferase